LTENLSLQEHIPIICWLCLQYSTGDSITDRVYSSLTRIASGLPRLIISETPAGRIGEPEDITGAAVFLASGASDFVTGKYIQVEGGRHAGDMAWPPKTKG
jgi:NAD(P)-dependent dehydrogenase (short-subunit alcohol dehydrogenase family)